MRGREDAVVEAILAERPGAQELAVRLVEPPHQAERMPEVRSAVNLVALTGRAVVGDRVLLNTFANALRLGTGGQDFVIALLDRIEDASPPGHIIKLRYTPLQLPVLSVEAPESPHHETLRRFTNLDDIPVVCAELHSQLPGICAAAYWALTPNAESPPPRIVYIMTDGAALPLALSRHVAELKANGLIAAAITAGQAFGGDYEAVNLYSAMAAAKDVAAADIIVVAQGPGTVGTGTPLGFSGVEQGLAINAAASLGATPIAVARISFAEARERHSGLSHHTVTVLTRVARATALLPIPRLSPGQQEQIRAVLESSGIAELHQPIIIDAELGLAALEAHDLNVTTMGRDLRQERPFFLAAAAAGLLAAQIVEARAAARNTPAFGAETAE